MKTILFFSKQNINHVCLATLSSTDSGCFVFQTFQFRQPGPGLGPGLGPGPGQGVQTLNN